LPGTHTTPNKLDNKLLNSSFTSNSFCDDRNDLTFEVDMDCDSSDNDSTHTDDSTELIEGDTQTLIANQRKFIVFESQLDDLFARLKCRECDFTVDMSDTVKDCSSGTILRVSVFCTNGHLIHRWLSQPLIGKMSAGNLLVSAATLFCGQTYTHIAQFAEFMNLKFITESTFITIQREYLMSVIQHTCSLLQAKLLDKIKSTNRTPQLAGDGRCDSPGFSAKYYTYSLLDMESQHILTFVTSKVTETGSSCKMEVEGFRRCMEYLLDKGFQIVVLGADRHVQIRSLMKKQHPEIEHQFDVCHLANSVRKKLLAKSKLKGAEDLGSWIKAICNHLWWCSSNSSGNKEWLEESFISIVHHVVNEHTFEGKMVTTCAHEPIAPEMARTKKWMKRVPRHIMH
jgi:solute carrier family 8 (sodium/calcium exchanger)